MKVLVCDDERHVNRLIQVNLERLGHEVVTAFDGREALEKVWSENPDLVVLDIKMPFVDGFEVLKTIRQDFHKVNLPVVLISGKVDQNDIFKGYQSGANMYLVKPFNPAELVTFLR